MPARFEEVDRDTPLILPPNLRDWVPAGHLAHFILDAVDELDLSRCKINHRGTGSKQMPPAMMMALIIYSYATGVFGSRRIEQSTHDSVPVRMICADTHPDHDTICTFRRENGPVVQAAFVRVLQLAQELKLLKVGAITTAIDGTKVMANASKHSAVSYQHAGKAIEQLDLEVKQLMAKAEQADNTPLEDGLSIPQEIIRRQERKAKRARARAEIEARAAARAAAQMPEYQVKLDEHEAKKDRGDKVGPAPKPPSGDAQPGDQYNFTDPESRIMKAGSGQHFEQAYNAQAAVEVDSRLIVGNRVSQAPNDKKELVATVESIPSQVGRPETVLADSGFYSQQAVAQVEQTPEGQPSGTTVYAAMDKKDHHRSVADLEKKQEPPPPPPGADMAQIMRYRLRTKAGRAKYKLRQQTVEPVFGIIKSAMRFRQFLLRGIQKATLEWDLVCLAYNLKRLHILGAAQKLAPI
jgi:transposase